MKLAFRLAALPCALVCAWTAQAQTADELPAVVVSATRTATPLPWQPASVDQISREALTAQQAHSVGEALKALPNVNFGGGPRAAGQIPTLRGYSGKQITVLVDGARANDANSLVTPINLDPYQLQNIEVVRGPTSALYGSGGLGGVISFNTVSARDLLAPGQSVGADVKLGYASADRSGHYHARVYGQHDTIDLLASLGYADWDRIRQGGGSLLKPNDGHAANAMLKLGIQPDARQRVQLSYLQYDETNLRPNNPQTDSALGPASAIPVQTNHARQDQAIVKYSALGDDGLNATEVTLYRTHLQRSNDRNPAFPTLPATWSDTTTTGLSAKDTRRFATGSVEHRLSYGLDYFEDHQSAASAGAPNPVLPDGRQKVYGAFMQDEIRLSPSWSLIPSLRADRYQTSVNGGSQDSRDSHVSPKLTLNWQARPDTLLYASYGEAYRAPSLTEMYTNLSGRNYLFNFAPNTGLRPETDRTLEVGVNHQARSLFAANDRLTVKAALFRSRVEDLISSTVIGSYVRVAPFTGVGLVQQSQNIADASRRGAELEAQYQQGGSQLSLAYSRLRVEDRNTGAQLFAPPDKLTLSLAQALPAGLSAHWRTQWVAAQDDDSTVARRTAGYTVSDAGLNWAVPGYKGVNVLFAVNNLFDKRYVSYQSSNVYARVLETGRNFKLSLSAAL